MEKVRFSQSIWIHLALSVLIYTTVLLALTWLMNRYWILKWISLGDALFAMGAFACAMAAVGMLRNPYLVWPSPWGIGKLPIHEDNEEEQRKQLVADFVKQSSFGLRLFVAGLLTIVVSLLVTYVK